MRPDQCECGTWARVYDRAETWLEHHPRCPNRSQHDGVKEYALEVVKALEEWGGMEDGIPDFAWGVYEIARHLAGLPRVPFETQQLNSKEPRQ